MIKLNKYFSLAVMAMMGAGLVTSCDNSKDSFDYDVYPGQVGLDVYFPANTPTEYAMNTAGGSFTITIMRSDNSTEATVPVTVTSLSNDNVISALSFPSSVTFSQGSNSASYNVSYVDFETSGIGYDNFQVYKLAISDEYKTPFGSGSTEIEIKASYPSPWDYLGKATYTDYFVGTFFGVDDLAYQVDLYENSLTPGLFRLMNPYGAAYPYNEPGDWDTSETYYLYINATNPDQVFISDNAGNATFFYSGMDWGYGEFVMTTFASYYLSRGDADTAAQYYGTMENGVIYLAGSSTLCAMEDYNGGGLYSRSFNGPAQWIVLPGTTVSDTSVEVTYNGMLHKPDETMEVVAYVQLGADVTEAKVALVSGSSVSQDQIEGIVNGSVESTSVTSSGEVKLAFDSSNPSGKYSIVAVSFEGGEAKESAVASFSYTAGTPETWTLVGTGIYSYLDFWQENLGLEPEELELYESDATPGKFKITHWMNDQDFQFTVDADGTIYVAEEQSTGVTSGGVEIWVDDTTLWGLEAGGIEDGVYYFGVVYYNSDSFGVYAYGYESFEPQVGASTASYKTRSGRVSLEKGKALHLNARKMVNASLSKAGNQFTPVSFLTK